MLTTQTPINQSPAKTIRQISLIKSSLSSINPSDSVNDEERDSKSFESDSEQSQSTAPLGYNHDDSIDLTTDYKQPEGLDRDDNDTPELLKPCGKVDQMVQEYKAKYAGYSELDPSEKLYVSLVHLVTDLKEDYIKEADNINSAREKALQLSDLKIKEFEKLRMDWLAVYEKNMAAMKEQDVLASLM